MSFAKIVKTSEGEEVIIMRAIGPTGWTIFAKILRPDNRVHTHQLTFEEDEGEELTEQLFNEIGILSADSVKQGMLAAVATES